MDWTSCSKVMSGGVLGTGVGGADGEVEAVGSGGVGEAGLLHLLGGGGVAGGRGPDPSVRLPSVCSG